MAIGTTAAILGAAVIGAGATAMSSKSNSKAINQATAAQQKSEADQIAFQREARAENTAALTPWMQRGNVAGETINAALGLGGDQNAATKAYEAFKISTGYSSRFDEGMRALESNYFGGRVGQSGAAIKAAQRYGQDFASGEFGKWLGALGNQQGVGFAGASALAGVSQGFADRMSDISQNSANNQSQAAIARAQNNSAMWSGIAGNVGQAAGALSSYRPPINYNMAALVPDVNAMIARNPGLF